MNIREQKKQAKEFIKRWSGRGNERQDSQSFWLDLLGSVYGIETLQPILLLKIRLCLTIQVLLMVI